MSSSNSISQQQNTPNTNETHRDYKEIVMPEQEFTTINNNDFNIQNKTSKSESLKYYVNDDTEKTKVNNECKMYENRTKYPLLTLEDALADRTALCLKEFDKILDFYHKHNNISDTIDPISLDDLHLILNNAESNVLNVEEKSNIPLDKNNVRDADVLDSNLYNNTNSKAEDNVEILVENKTEIEVMDMNNITLYNINTSDIISVSSDEDVKEKSLDQNDSDCSGYHSSDFEFIDEEEAKKFGYYFSKQETKEQNLDNFIINDYFDTLFPKDEQNNDKNNHLIPEGDNFVNLFNENCMRRSFSYDVESKSVTTGVSMNTNFESIGFHIPRYRENPELEAFRQDAYDSARKIRLMYPQENKWRRTRRRYRKLN